MYVYVVALPYFRLRDYGETRILKANFININSACCYRSIASSSFNVCRIKSRVGQETYYPLVSQKVVYQRWSNHNYRSIG